jgi:polyisoprenyl-teichoic acid--peptidoglycan teichoic acid transferase
MMITPSTGPRSESLAVLLSLVWPGLGQLYRGERRRALVFAVPPILVAIAVGSVVLLMGPAMIFLYLLHPVYAAMAGILVVAAGAWWLTAAFDAGRPHSRSSLGLAALAAVVLLVGVGWSGQVLWALYEAGTLIGRPLEEPSADDDDVDDGPAHSPPAAAASPFVPPSPTPQLLPGDRITVLLLGTDQSRGRSIGLTDTIQVASFNPRTGEVVMISIPRDVGQLPMYNGGMWDRKINSLLAHAQRRPHEFPDGGIGTLMRQVGYIIGVPVHYYAVVDFSGFERIVDTVGGVEVELERPLNDPTYQISPTERGLHLEPGVHTLDGRTALMYVRSRRGPGNSDFERARRQQQVLLALRDKIDEPHVLASLPSLINATADSVRTNAPLDRLPQLVELLQKSRSADTRTYVLQPRRYAETVPRSEIGNVFMLRLRMERVAELSIELFGEESRYWLEQQVEQPAH